MAATPFTNATTLLPAAAFLARADYRTVGKLCSDTGVPVASAALGADANLAAALLDASGAVEAAALVGKRYTPEDLAALTGAAQGHLYRLITRLTMLYLWERRPDIELDMGDVVKEALEELERIKQGVRVFGTVEGTDAGLLQSPKMTEQKVRERNEVSVICSRLFGRRANQNETRE